MKKVLSLVVFVMVFATVFAQTTIPGGDVSGSWNMAGSPFIVQGDITLQSGQILTIDGGVTIQFTGEFKFDIYGQMITNSDNDNWITFTNNGTNGGMAYVL